VVVVESHDLEKNRQFIERIAAKMQAKRPVSRRFLPAEPGDDGDKALQFASETNLVQMRNMLHTARPFIQQFTQMTNLVSLFDQVNNAFRTAKQEENSDTESLVKSSAGLQRIVSQAHDALLRAGVPPSPNVSTLLDNRRRNAGPATSRSTTRIFVVTQPWPKTR